MTEKIHHLSIEQVLNSLHTTRDGLTADEAKRRLGEFGPNAIHKIESKSLLLRFLAGFTHFFALILWFGAGIAFFAEWSAPGGGMGLLGYAILGVIVINGLFSFWQEFRAEQAINALQKLIPHEANVFRHGKLQRLPAEELVPGDIISLQDGDDVPADCRVLESIRLRVNNATMTGESMPVGKDNKASREDEALHSKNVLLTGTAIFSGEAQAVVFSTGMNTEFGKIARLAQTTEEELSPLQKEIVRLSRIIALIAVSVGVFFFFLGRAVGITFWENVIFALGIIVALVPEGLLPEVTLALATCAQRMAKRNALIRHLPSVETLGCTTVICTDKTGTLTQNKMQVKELFLGGEAIKLAQGEGLPQSNQNLIDFFCEIAYNCHNLKEIEADGKTHLAGDPMEIAMVECAKQLNSAIAAMKRLDEIPFDTERKRVSVLVETENTPTVLTKGALEAVLPLCRTIDTAGSIDNTGTFTLTEENRKALIAAEESMTKRGLRVLALAYRPVSSDYDPNNLETNMTMLGLLGLEDPPRPEVPEAMRKCKEAGIKVIMVTGDHPNTAQAIANEIGLIESANPVIITGTQLKKMTAAELQLVLDAPEIIFARTDPAQKRRIVESLKKKGQIVAVTGDGANDAPALKAADIGISMGISGTDVAREAADMILADDNFASIVNAIEEGRAVFANIRKFLTYVLSSNIAELIPCLAFVLFRIPLPLTTIQILSVDLGTDIVPALALGIEKPDPSIMSMPPRTKQEGLFDLSLLLRAYLYLGVMVSIGSMAAYFFVLSHGGWHFGQQLPPSSTLYKTATAACLSGIMCMQIVNSSMCRSETLSIFSLGALSNRFLIFGIFCQILLMLFIVYTPWGNLFFHTAPLDLSVWLYMVPFMVAMCLMEEARKWIVRRKRV